MANLQEFARHFWPKELVFDPHSPPPLEEEILSVKREHSFFEYAAVGILMVSMSSVLVFFSYSGQKVDPNVFVVNGFFYLVFVLSFGIFSVEILRHANAQDYADIPLAKAEDVIRVFSSHPLLWEYFTAIKKQGRLPARYEYKGATRYSLLNAQEKESFQQNMLSDEPNFSTKHPVDMD